MFEAIVAGLVLAAVTGLAWFAYTHPIAYNKKIAPALLIAVFGVFIAFAAWDVAVQSAHTAVIPCIAADKFTEAQEALDALRSPWWTAFVIWGIVSYLMFLGYLPELIKDTPAAKSE